VLRDNYSITTFVFRISKINQEHTDQRSNSRMRVGHFSMSMIPIVNTSVQWRHSLQ